MWVSSPGKIPACVKGTINLEQVFFVSFLFSFFFFFFFFVCFCLILFVFVFVFCGVFFIKRKTYFLVCLFV